MSRMRDMELFALEKNIWLLLELFRIICYQMKKKVDKMTYESYNKNEIYFIKLADLKYL